MRRADRAVTDREKILQILDACHCCRVGFSDPDGAYIVPLSFAFVPGTPDRFYFHGAKEGRKAARIAARPKVGFELDCSYALVEGTSGCSYSCRYQSIVGTGVIGEVQAIDANLCYPTTAKARITDPALAGGALLDVGVYPINFIDMIMHNAPIARVESSMQPYETGVDAHNSMTFYYQNGVMATAQSSILCHSDRMGAVWGTKGYLTCQNINNVEAIDVFDGSHAVTAHYDVPEQLTGYEYEVASAAQAMLDGRTECDEMPHSDTLRIMECMDSLRADWGLKYPFEA